MRISLGILSFAAFSVLAGCAKTQKAGPEPVPVVAEIVATQQVQPSWNYSGEIRPDAEVQLAFKEPGYIATLYRVKGVDGRMRDVQVGEAFRVSKRDRTQQRRVNGGKRRRCRENAESQGPHR